MGFKKMAEKFERIDKKKVRGKVKHTRTGACTAKSGQKCQHGKSKS